MSFVQEFLSLPLVHDTESGLLVLLLGKKMLPLCNTKTGSMYLLARNHAEMPQPDTAMTFKSSEGWRVGLKDGDEMTAQDGAANALLYNLQLDDKTNPLGPLLDMGQFYEAAGSLHAKELDGQSISTVSQQAMDVFFAYRRGDVSAVEAAHEGERLALLLTMLPEAMQNAILDVKVGVEEGVPDSAIILDPKTLH